MASETLPDFLYLISSEINTSVKGETSNGGNITIDPQLAILNRSSIVAQAVEGHGGNITINAGEFIPSSDSIVSATSQLGICGAIEINGRGWMSMAPWSCCRANCAAVRRCCGRPARRAVIIRYRAWSRPVGVALLQDPDATLPALYIAGRDVNPEAQAGADMTEANSVPQTKGQSKSWTSVSVPPTSRILVLGSSPAHATRKAS